MTFLIDLLFLLRDVKLPEEIKGDDRVDVDEDGQQHDGQNQLLSVVRDGLQDDAKGGHAHGHVQQVGSEEEVVPVAEKGEDEVPELVLERLYGIYPN